MTMSNIASAMPQGMASSMARCERALELLHTHRGNASAEVDQILADDPQCVFAHCLRELTAALLLQGADNATLPTLLYTYWSGGETNKAAAVGVWLVLGLLAVVLIWQVLQRLAAGGHSSARIGPA